jgi:hypothetical protein
MTTANIENRFEIAERSDVECETLRPLTQKGIVDRQLTPEAERVKRLAQYSLIGSLSQRAASTFLGTDDYEKVEISGELTGLLMLECLPRFIRERRGQIVFSTRMDRHMDRPMNVIQTCIEVDGENRPVLLVGHLFIHLPDQLVVISSERDRRGPSIILQICVRSNRDSAGLLEEWKQYTRKNNYLRGRAFWGDGELIKQKRTYTWDDIMLSEEVRRIIRVHVERFLSHRDQLRGLRVKRRRGLVFAGPPGTGKTLLGRVLASIMKGTSFMWVSARHVKYGESVAGLMAVARLVAPAVVFLEDLDLFAEDRNDRGGGPVLGELMQQLDGAIENEEIVCLATTNRLEAVEKALRNRPGRFDRVVEMAELDDPCRRRMLAMLLEGTRVEPAEMDHLASATKGYTGAQLEEVANTICLLAAEDGVVELRSDNGDEPRGTFEVTRDLIDRALGEIQVDRKSRMGFQGSEE